MQKSEIHTLRAAIFRERPSAAEMAERMGLKKSALSGQWAKLSKLGFDVGPPLERGAPMKTATNKDK